MKWRLGFAVLVGGSLLEIGCSPRMEEMPVQSLRFEHVGPQDASISPFLLEVGRPTESTHAVILVTPDAYANILALVKEAGALPPRSPRPLGTFRVEIQGGEAGRSFIIYPETMLSIIGRLRRMFESQGSQLPDVLVKLETLLTPRK